MRKKNEYKLKNINWKLLKRKYFEYKVKTGLSDKRVAKEIGIGKDTISKWINGRRRASIDLLTKFCKKIGIKPEDIIIE